MVPAWYGSSLVVFVAPFLYPLVVLAQLVFGLIFMLKGPAPHGAEDRRRGQSFGDATGPRTGGAMDDALDAMLAERAAARRTPPPVRATAGP